MSVTATVMAIVLAVLFLGLGVAKILKLPPTPENAEHLGYSARSFQAIGAAEVAAAAGLIGGLFWAPLGIAAAAGLVVLLAGAVRAHQQAGDGIKQFFPAVWVGLVAGATAVVTALAM